MGVRAIRTRIECDRETLLALWRTHRVFNERLPSLITTLFAMRRGEVGATQKQRDVYQRVARFILARDSKDAIDLLNAVSIKKRSAKSAFSKKATIRWCDGEEREVTGQEVFAEAVRWTTEGTFAYDKEAMRDGLPDSIFQPLTRDAVAYISGHDELVRNWEREHAEWQTKRTEWEAKDENKKYLALLPRFRAFEESVGGQAGKRRERWHLYLKWLRENPDLAGWRGGEKTVNALDAKAQARIAKARPWKQRSVEAEEFWKANPELAALDKLHGLYRREFIRRRRTKRNKWKEGFKQRPTFTMPDPILHPRWALFNAPQTQPEGYDDLRLPSGPGEAGFVKLRVLTEEKDGAKWPNKWVEVRFSADPRLLQFRVVGRRAKKNRNKTLPEYVYWDAQLNCERRNKKKPIKPMIGGAKLILEDIRLNDDGSLKSATPYLVFACTIDNVPQTDRARAIQWPETGEVTKSGKKRRSKKLPPGLVTCAVDLGIRNLGFLTLAVASDGPGDGVRVLRSRNQWLGETEDRGNHAGRWSAGPDLAHIGSHKRKIKRLRQLRGKPVKGEQSHVELQQHIDGMGKDRFKKAARAIVNFALNVENAAGSKTGEVYPRADVLIVEKLAGFIPDAERERGINRALVAWNRGQLVTRIKEVAADAGLKLYEVHPAGTSQCCSKCGALGRRYSIARDDENHQPVIRFGWVEKLFACPNPKCSGRDPRKPERPFTCNSDHNASVNLHRQFILPDTKGRPAEVHKREWTDRSKPDRETLIRQMEDALRQQLEALHGLPASTLETPF